MTQKPNGKFATAVMIAPPVSRGISSCMRLLVPGSVLRCVPACRCELAGFYLSLPQLPLTFQPELQFTELPPLFCEVASLMVLQALRKALCVSGLLADPSSLLSCCFRIRVACGKERSPCSPNSGL